MARTKNLKSGNELENDFTFNEPKEVVIRFNSANVLKIKIDRTANTISGTLNDEITGTNYTVAGTLTEA